MNLNRRNSQPEPADRRSKKKTDGLTASAEDGVVVDVTFK